MQGTADTTLTPQLAIDLHEALKEKYAAREEPRLQLKLADGVSHDVTEAASLADLREWTAAWFNRW